LWAFTGLAGFVAESETATVWIGLTANGLGFATAVSWFLFILTYLGYGHQIGRRLGTVCLLTGGGLYFFLYVTSGWTQLLVRDLNVVEWHVFETLHLQPTILGAVWLMVGFSLFFVGLALILQRLFTNEIQPTQAGLLAVAALLPVTAGLVVGFLLIPAGVPLVQVGASVSVSLYALALRQYDLFTFAPATEQIGVDRAFDELGAGVVITADDGTVIRVNAASCAILGVEEQSLLGSSTETVLDQFGVGRETLPTVVESGGQYYRLGKSSITDESGRTIGRSFLFTDITSRRLREQRLDVLNRVLRHNLRNKLSVITGRSRIAAERSQREDVVEELDLVTDAARELHSISEKARTLEELIDGNSTNETVFIAETVENILEELACQRVKTTLQIEEGLTLTTDEQLFSLVVENLLENAVIHNDTAQPHLTVTAKKADTSVQLQIRDNGPGIPEHELETLQEGKETPLEHASGLGLWLVTWATSRLGGSVEFERTGSGTLVEVTVPDKSESTDQSLDTIAKTDRT